MVGPDADHRHPSRLEQLEGGGHVEHRLRPAAHDRHLAWRPARRCRTRRRSWCPPRDGRRRCPRLPSPRCPPAPPGAWWPTRSWPPAAALASNGPRSRAPALAIGRVEVRQALDERCVRSDHQLAVGQGGRGGHRPRLAHGGFGGQRRLEVVRVRQPWAIRLDSSATTAPPRGKRLADLVAESAGSCGRCLAIHAALGSQHARHLRPQLGCPPPWRPSAHPRLGGQLAFFVPVSATSSAAAKASPLPVASSIGPRSCGAAASSRSPSATAAEPSAPTVTITTDASGCRAAAAARARAGRPARSASASSPLMITQVRARLLQPRPEARHARRIRRHGAARDAQPHLLPRLPSSSASASPVRSSSSG